MWINTYVGILASLAAITTATPHHYLDYPYFPYTPYSSNLYHGPSIHSQFDYTLPYNFHTGHSNFHSALSSLPQFKHPPHFRGFTYHNDFKGGSTSNVLFLTGGVGQPIPSFPYPALESPAVEIARKKASNSVDKNFIEKKINTKDLCQTFQDAFGKPGVHQFYSIDNNPLFLGSGFEFNQIPTVSPWPFGNEFFGTPLIPAGENGKPKIAGVDTKKTDDDVVVDPERKISVRPIDQGAQDSVSVSSDTTASPNAVNDSTGQEEDETRTIPNLPSSEATSTSATDSTQSDDSEAVDASKRKRQSGRVSKAKRS